MILGSTGRPLWHILWGGGPSFSFVSTNHALAYGGVEQNDRPSSAGRVRRMSTDQLIAGRVGRSSSAGGVMELVHKMALVVVVVMAASAGSCMLVGG